MGNSLEENFVLQIEHKYTANYIRKLCINSGEKRINTLIERVLINQSVDFFKWLYLSSGYP